MINVLLSIYMLYNMITYWRLSELEMPDDMTPVIVCVECDFQSEDNTKFYPFQTIGRVERGSWVICNGPDEMELKSREEVTHWMPFPKFPSLLKYR
jgi:hypothetical protein